MSTCLPLPRCHLVTVVASSASVPAISIGAADPAVSGDRAKVVATGENSVIAISGLSGCFKGVNGTFVSCADFDDDGKCVGFVTGCIGKDGLKENTWYTVRNGKGKRSTYNYYFRTA